MSYTVKYDQATREARLEAARQDARQYLGNEYPRLIKILRDVKRLPNTSARKKVRLARFGCEMRGLRYAPATAAIKDAWRSQ